MKAPTDKLLEKAYDDVVSPGAKELGRTLGNVVRTALRPANGVVWTIDQAFDWAAEKVVRQLEHRKVPRKRVVRPSVLIEGRILQALQVAGPSEDPQLRNMFAALLASSMDSQTAQLVHPSFVSALSQLVPDEARLFSLVSHYRFMAINAWNRPCRFGDSFAWRYHYYEECAFDHIGEHNYLHFVESLQHLGIIEVRDDDRSHRADLLHTPGIGNVFEKWRQFVFELRRKRRLGKVTEKESREIYDAFELNHFRITRWGENLASACAASEFYESGRLRMPGWANG